jgi:hypothetical protein
MMVQIFFFLTVHLNRPFDLPRFLCSGLIGSIGINSECMKPIFTSIFILLEWVFISVWFVKKKLFEQIKIKL